jgi:hypothetical protein
MGIQTTDADMVQKNLYGVGFSPLSISNKDHALPEELMANKEVGLFYINSKEGDYPLSAEYVARCKLHLKEFIKQCVHENTLGKIYKIFLDDKGAQTAIANRNFFINTLTYALGAEPLKAFRFNIDADLLAKDLCIAVDPRSIKFKIQFSLIRGTEEQKYYVEENFEDINRKAFAVDMTGIAEEGDYSFRIDTFQVIVPNNFNSATQSIVVYDILLALI